MLSQLQVISTKLLCLREDGEVISRIPRDITHQKTIKKSSVDGINKQLFCEVFANMVIN